MTSTPDPDRQFSDPRLAAVYDDIDGERDDLDLYEAIVAEFGATSVLDVGCGTGMLAARLAANGVAVTGVDPALASLHIARSRTPEARWIHGDATTLPPMAVDLATMTGNVAQVFTTDDAWRSTLDGIHGALRHGGHLVFETRDPARRVWERWAEWRSSAHHTSAGPVEYSVDVIEVALPLVTFRATYRFGVDGETITSDSTLRFRDEAEVTADLAATGFEVIEVRDTPDRPSLELVFIARKRTGS